jgi:hypothetical protein
MARPLTLLTLAVVAPLIAPTPLHAESTLTITLNDLGTQLAGDLGLELPAFIAQTEGRIDELYRLSRTNELLRTFANVAAFAQRGLGVDYDPDPGDRMFGIVGAGFQGDLSIGSDSEFAGASINASAMVGINLARWGLPRWTVFANGFYLATTVRALEGSLLTAGAHVSYRLLLPSPRQVGANVRWTGLTVTTGLEHGQWNVGAAQALETNVKVTGTVDGASKDKSIHLSSTGVLEVRTSTLAIPVELTTGVRLLGVVTPYLGVGASLATGSSDLDLDLTSTLTINADRLPIGEARITGSDRATPDPLAVHALAGLQLHTRHARIAAQGTLTEGAWAASLALRIAL